MCLLLYVDNELDIRKKQLETCFQVLTGFSFLKMIVTKITIIYSVIMFQKLLCFEYL